MKKFWSFLCLVALALSPVLPLLADDNAGESSAAPARATAAAPAATLTIPTGTGPVFVIPVQDQIEGALVYVFRRGLAEAISANARAIVLDMDTPGGRLDAVWKIMELLQRSPIPTYTFVNPNAISGGALIALATDHIVMSPGAMIGDAKPIMGSPLPFGSPQEVPDGLQEKVNSPARAKIRAACQHKGRDEKVAEAMMDESIEVIRDGHVINPVGKILTLTAEEAARQYGDPPRPLLSDGTFDSLDALLQHLGMRPEETPRHLEVSSAERIARWLSGPLSPLLLGLGLLLLYIEARTPGFGVPGLSGILLLGLWFWGQHIAALAGMGELILFLLGLTLLLIEIFVIPGFGMTGITGIVLIITSFVLSMVEVLPGGGMFEFPAGMLAGALLKMTLSLVVLTLGAWFVGGLLPRTRSFQVLTLQTVVEGSVQPQAAAAAATADSLQPGLAGKTLSPCRPGGIGLFAGQRLDIVSTGEFLAAGIAVELVAKQTNNWKVRALSQPEEKSEVS